MAQAYKVEEVKQLKKRLKDSKAIVLIDYKGINIEQVDELRNRMRNSEVDYFVSKNTFIKIALNELGITELDEYLKGPTAVATTSADEVAPARELAKFKKDLMKDFDFPYFKIGFINGSIMEPEDLDKLAKLPSKDQLLSMVLQGFNAPITGLVGALSGIIRNFVYVVDAIKTEKEEKN